MPNYTARMQYLNAVYDRYQKASKEDKSRILDEFSKVCSYNRNYAIQLLAGPKPTSRPTRIHRRRPFRYSPAVLQVARAIWKASGYLCGSRLKQAIPLWLPAARRRFRFTSTLEKDLLSISARQLDARLKSHKLALRRRFYSTTRPGRLLKSMIPIRTFNSDIRRPGYLEIDTVAHCGRSLQGDFLYTLTATDIFTGWTDRVAVFGKGQTGIVEGLKTIQNRLPFRLRGIDCDNGEEFINYHLLGFCRAAHLEFTRSRPYKKNDNPHVEQKNFTHVRTFLGWHRFESLKARDYLNALYAQELLLFQNLFQPSVKLKTKVHIGSKVHRTYEQALTPLDRLIASHRGRPDSLRHFKTQRQNIDPFELSESIDQKLQALRALAASPTPPPPLTKEGPRPDQVPYLQSFFPSVRRNLHQLQKATIDHTTKPRKEFGVT